MKEDELLRSSFIGIRNEPLPPIRKSLFDRVCLKTSHCPDCVKFELPSCPYPDSDMRDTNCNHFDSKRSYREVI